MRFATGVDLSQVFEASSYDRSRHGPLVPDVGKTHENSIAACRPDRRCRILSTAFANSVAPAVKLGVVMNTPRRPLACGDPV